MTRRSHRGSRHCLGTGLLALACWAGACAAGADQPAEFADISGRINALTDQLRRQGAMLDQPDLCRHLPLAVARIFDPNAEMISVQQAEWRTELDLGYYYDIGATIDLQVDRPIIVDIDSDGPAAAAGIEPQTVVTKINGRTVTGMSMTDILAQIRGAPDQPVTLELLPPDNGEPLTVRLERSFRRLPVTGQIEDWPMRIAYVRISGIHDGSGENLRRQIIEWAQAEMIGIIIDLRGAGGIDFDSVGKIAGLFVDTSGPLFSITDGHDQTRQITAQKPDDGILSLPIMALIDESTRGAAEVLAAVLRHSSRAMLIGAPSRNDMTRRTSIPLDGERALYMITARVHLPDAGDSQLQPDVPVTARATAQDKPPEPAGTKFPDGLSDQERLEKQLAGRIGADAALRRAADILLGLNALKLRPR